MSGVSLAVAPRSDPDETFTTSTADSKTQHHRQQEQTVVGGIMGSLRVIELQLVAFIMVFSASGLVPLFDLAFPVFTTIYLLLLSRLAFPGSTSTASKEIFQGNRVFRAYVIFGTTVGLFLPLAYVLGGFARGDEHAVQSATPHLFLLSCQILTENIISGLSLFSPPVRALVPMLYTVRRIFVILDWVQDVWLNKTLSPNAQIQDVAWFWFGRGLAVANLGYFSINMFVFLIPRFLPKAFDQYFRERNEIQRKIGEDKQFAGVRRDKKSD
ncbi:uncharacterized protein LOC111889825 [Lactuca sativa]|uniref:DUF7733 domain-containing protein n=1 Tax=Lactuca sativa TaxID=4236 RepID=A0A9R1W084_LACSA|nr:uncharacterized protein LOC111889825 [Lactuca sativa]KAJ0213638.1 hypothetical protein LSAT_V11C400157550 [Lactuca sativa]